MARRTLGDSSQGGSSNSFFASTLCSLAVGNRPWRKLLSLRMHCTGHSTQCHIRDLSLTIFVHHFRSAGTRLRRSYGSSSDLDGKSHFQRILLSFLFGGICFRFFRLFPLLFLLSLTVNVSVYYGFKFTCTCSSDTYYTG